MTRAPCPVCGDPRHDAHAHDAPGGPPPAEFEVSRITVNGIVNVYTCSWHLPQAVRVLWQDSIAVAVKPANPQVHGCKGHQEQWPTPQIPRP